MVGCLGDAPKFAAPLAGCLGDAPKFPAPLAGCLGDAPKFAPPLVSCSPNAANVAEPLVGCSTNTSRIAPPLVGCSRNASNIAKALVGRPPPQWNSPRPLVGRADRSEYPGIVRYCSGVDNDGDSRKIPAETRLHLRREVNFGCPAPRCGNPLLTFHHFDPPFHEGHSHDPAGIVALCREHHDRADPKGSDRGLYSVETLRGFKRDPWVKDKLNGRLFELPRRFVVFAGGGEARSSSMVLRVGGVPMFRIRGALHESALDLSMMDLAGNLALEIRRDALVAHTQLLRDAVFPPKATRWSVDAGNAGFVELKFQRLQREQFADHLVRSWRGRFPTFEQQLSGITAFASRDPLRAAAERRIEGYDDVVDDDGTYGVVELTMRVPIVDLNGTLATLRVDPWTCDVQFAAGTRELALDFFCHGPTGIERPSGSSIAPLFRVNVLACAVESHQVTRVLSVEAIAEEPSPDTFWSEILIERAARLLSRGQRGDASRVIRELDVFDKETRVAAALLHHQLGDSHARDALLETLPWDDSDGPVLLVRAILEPKGPKRVALFEDVLRASFRVPVLNDFRRMLGVQLASDGSIASAGPPTGPARGTLSPRTLFASDELEIDRPVTLVEFPGEGNRIQMVRRAAPPD
ncbi:MAG: HNH endonuclease [Deltaproteobacteria bacterium]|nr:HNH endonuclease [Deltaproteobacteria bacterium]